MLAVVPLVPVSQIRHYADMKAPMAHHLVFKTVPPVKDALNEFPITSTSRASTTSLINSATLIATDIPSLARLRLASSQAALNRRFHVCRSGVECAGSTGRSALCSRVRSPASAFVGTLDPAPDDHPNLVLVSEPKRLSHKHSKDVIWPGCRRSPVYVVNVPDLYLFNCRAFSGL